MNGGQPVIVETTADSRFKMSAEQLEAAITPRTKALVLNNPSNPTGMVYSREELQALCDDPLLVRQYQLNASDFICQKYSWDAVCQRTLALYTQTEE